MSSLSKNSAAIQFFHFLFPQPMLFLPLPLWSRCHCLLLAPTLSLWAACTTVGCLHTLSSRPRSPTSRPPILQGPLLPVVRRGAGASRAEIWPGHLPPRAQLPMQSSLHNKELRHAHRNALPKAHGCFSRSNSPAWGQQHPTEQGTGSVQAGSISLQWFQPPGC